MSRKVRGKNASNAGGNYVHVDLAVHDDATVIVLSFLKAAKIWVDAFRRSSSSRDGRSDGELLAYEPLDLLSPLRLWLDIFRVAFIRDLLNRLQQAFITAGGRIEVGRMRLDVSQFQSRIDTIITPAFLENNAVHINRIDTAFAVLASNNPIEKTEQKAASELLETRGRNATACGEEKTGRNEKRSKKSRSRHSVAVPAHRDCTPEPQTLRQEVECITQQLEKLKMNAALTFGDIDLLVCEMLFNIREHIAETCGEQFLEKLEGVPDEVHSVFKDVIDMFLEP